MTTLAERTKILARNFEGWSEDLKQEVSMPSSQIGSSVIFENEEIRVWTILLRPGERLAFHKHTRPYFWVVHTHGEAITHIGTGETKQISYQPNDTKMPITEKGGEDSFAHDVINIGQNDLHFTTTEFLSPGKK